MFKQIMDGKILRLGYKKEVKQLLAAMTATYINKKPVSVLRLADYYFNKLEDKKDPDINAVLLRFEIAKNTHPKVAESVNTLLEELYR